MLMILMEREDLINLVCGVQPHYDLFSELSYYGEFRDNRGWEWKKHALKTVSDDALLDMYYKIKKSWELRDK